MTAYLIVTGKHRDWETCFPDTISWLGDCFPVTKCFPVTIGGGGSSIGPEKIGCGAKWLSSRLGSGTGSPLSANSSASAKAESSDFSSLIRSPSVNSMTVSLLKSASREERVEWQ